MVAPECSHPISLWSPRPTSWTCDLRQWVKAKPRISNEDRGESSAFWNLNTKVEEPQGSLTTRGGGGEGGA